LLREKKKRREEKREKGGLVQVCDTRLDGAAARSEGTESRIASSNLASDSQSPGLPHFADWVHL
jgi:hypothetical protein